MIRAWAEAGTKMEKFPFSSVVVPVEEFLMVTEAPYTGLFDSSRTFPVMVLFCAHKLKEHSSRRKQNTPSKSLFICKFFSFGRLINVSRDQIYLNISFA